MGIIEAAVEELELERQAFGTPDRLVRLEADHAVAVVGEVLQDVGQLVVRRLVGLLCEIARKRAQPARLERRGVLLCLRLGDERARKRTADEGQRQTGSQQITTTQGPNPLKVVCFWKQRRAAAER